MKRERAANSERMSKLSQKSAFPSGEKFKTKTAWMRHVACLRLPAQTGYIS